MLKLLSYLFVSKLFAFVIFTDTFKTIPFFSWRKQYISMIISDKFLTLCTLKKVKVLFVVYYILFQIF